MSGQHAWDIIRGMEDTFEIDGMVDIGVIHNFIQCITGNFDSRYFTADFPWGLKIIKEIAELYEVAAPNIDKIWRWYEEHARKDEEMPFELYLDKDGFVNLYQ